MGNNNISVTNDPAFQIDIPKIEPNLSDLKSAPPISALDSSLMEHDYSDEEIAHIPISDSHETTAPVEALGSEALCPIKVKVTPDGSYDVYTVQNGDYVDDIAYRCETTRHGLLTHNPQITQSTDAYERSITGDQIYVGEELRLPDIYESSGHSVFSITDNPFQSVSSQLEKREDTMFYLQQSPLGIFFRSVANMVGL